MATTRATPINNRGGYDYSFVHTPPDELVCKICHHPSREPYLSVCCGHTFCKTCLEGAKQVSDASSVVNSCPVCRTEKYTTFPNRQNERAIKNLHVFCINKSKGCDWQDEMNKLNGHLENSDGCAFEEVICSNGCGLSLQRQKLREHIDTECPRFNITCQHCKATAERQFITGQNLSQNLHKEQCPKYALPCPNECEKKVLRENIDAHKAECPLEMIQCNYYEMGCNDSMARKDQAEHDQERMENHLSLVKSEYLHTKSKLADAEKKIEELKSAMEQIESQLQQKTQLLEEELKSAMKQSEHESQLQQKTQLLEEKLRSAMKQSESQLQQKIQSLEEKLKSAMKQSESQLQQKTQLLEDMMFKHVFQWRSTLEEKVKSNNTSMPITLKMSEYSKKKKNNSNWHAYFSWVISFSWENKCISWEKKLFNSSQKDSFLWQFRKLETSSSHLEMKLRVIPSGHDGKGTHLSVQLYLVKGPGSSRTEMTQLEHTIAAKEKEYQSEFCYQNSRIRSWYSNYNGYVKRTQELEKENERLQCLKAEEREWYNIGKTSHLSVTICNQITDSEHYSVQTDHIDLETNYFLTKKDREVLIFDSRCFVPIEVLYKSTATCRYLKDDNIYFLIKVQ